MNEEPKSFWKKSWKGRNAILIWGALVGIVIFLAIFIAAVGKADTPLVDVFTAAAFLGIVGIVCCLLLIYVFIPFLRWLLWKHWRRMLFGLACLATLIALFYAEEDWRGWHAWNKFKHQWEAKGERFDVASVIPSTVPDDQNFAMTPIVASCYGSMLDKSGHQIQPRLTNVVDRLQMNIYRDSDNSRNWPPTNGNWQKGTPTDLKGWQQYYRNPPKSNSGSAKTNEFPVAPEPQSPATDVLLALSKYDSVIEELRQASQMPYSRFPLNYDNEPPAAILLPHLAALKRCSQVLQLRAIAELQNGQSEKSFADVKLMLRLVGSIHTEPFLISHLVHIAVVNFALQPVWEGLAEHKWSDAQLAELERELAGLDFLADYKVGMRGELVLCQIGNIEYLRRLPERIPDLAGGDDSSPPAPARTICWFIPSGWFYQNELRCAHMMLEQYLPMVDTERRIVSPAAARRAGATIEADCKYRNPYNILENMFLPGLSAAAKKFSWGQEIADLARVACALERYRLAYGEFPESLDALTPQFINKLPHDIINGQPLHYRRTSDGQFVLYSVGWNETDDGGVVALDGPYGKSGNVNINQGDWVWRYPAK